MTKTALVIGCGGTIGGAWIVAALQALAEQTGTDPAEAAVLQGTSAGAEIVTMLGGGASVTDLVAMHRGEASDPRLRRHFEDTPRGLPPIPRPRLLNPKLVRSESGLAAVTGIAPTGRGDAAWLQRLADGFQQADGWLAHPDTRMVAYDFQRGERVAFGAPGAPKATVGEALGRPGPSRLDATGGDRGPPLCRRRRRVDGVGGSLDPEDAEIIYVVAPMASAPGVRVPGHRRAAGVPAAAPAHVSRVLGGGRDRPRPGPKVIPIAPTAADLAGLGANFMAGPPSEAFDAAMRTAPAPSCGPGRPRPTRGRCVRREPRVVIIGAGVAGITALMCFSSEGSPTVPCWRRAPTLAGCGTGITTRV